MKYEVSKRTVQNKKHPFLLQYSCHPWTQMCYFVSGSSIQSSLTLPLSPFVALSTFCISQHPSLLVNPFHNDSTIQLLYSIATRVFQEQIMRHHFGKHLNDRTEKIFSSVNIGGGGRESDSVAGTFGKELGRGMEDGAEKIGF
ncbi:MAG: hypothetical protein EXX96DRAFT_534173 [Benjaminiella poitrasii]|nr:MAG: hypothetical protein EXX96DRAFT_534173 [Benjaminiella poitrasii]